jgi:hypothetical protein
MKKRGIVFILAAILAWVVFFHFVIEELRSGWGYELGSVAFPIPPLMRAVQMSASTSTLVGLAILVFDFVHWIRKPRDFH